MSLQNSLPLPLGPPFHPFTPQLSEWPLEDICQTTSLPALSSRRIWNEVPWSLPDPVWLQPLLSSISSHLSHTGFAHGQDLCTSVPSAWNTLCTNFSFCLLIFQILASLTTYPALPLWLLSGLTAIAPTELTTTWDHLTFLSPVRAQALPVVFPVTSLALVGAYLIVGLSKY